jgi:hypothetical protein
MKSRLEKIAKNHGKIRGAQKKQNAIDRTEVLDVDEGQHVRQYATQGERCNERVSE